MQAVILAGGFGTRLRACVPDLPKPMAPVAGRPFLEIILDRLARQGVRSVVMSLGYMAERISGHFGGAYAGVELRYVVEETPLGTGGGLRLAMEQCRPGPVLVLNGDTYVELDVAAMHARQRLHSRPLIAGCAMDDSSRYGRLQTDGGRVLGFLEKGAAVPGVINAGVYLLDRGALDRFPPGTAFSLERDYLEAEVRSGAFELFLTDGKFIDIGVPDDYARAQTELAGL